MSPLARLGRAATLAVVSTGTALALHVMAGGALPHPAGIAVPAALSFAAAMQLAGRRLSRWRLALAAAMSQVGFHLLFTLGAPVAVGAGPGTGTGTGTGTHGSHHSLRDLDVLVTPGPHATHSASSMALTHLLAAVITYAWLRHGEVVVAMLAAAASALTRGLARTMGIAGGVIAAPRSHLAARRGAQGTAIRYLGSPVGMRAPPVSIG